MFHLILNCSNSDAKLEKQLETVKETFAQAGKELEIHRTEHPRHAKEIAAELTAYGQRANLIAMGGDGTLHEVLNGIEDIKKCTLGLIPIGSGNDFAQAAGISLNPAVAAATIAFRAPSCVDYIQLENGLRSINAIGMGMDVYVTQRAIDKAAKKNGRKNYFSAFLKSLKSYECTKMKISWDDGEEKEFFGLVACVGNGVQFGGGIKLFPQAKINDGYLDLVIIDYISKLRTIGAFIKLVTGKIHKVREVTYVKCKKVRITPESGVAPVQAEGEIYDDVPLVAQIVTDKLKFYLPEND